MIPTTNFPRTITIQFKIINDIYSYHLLSTAYPIFSKKTVNKDYRMPSEKPSGYRKDRFDRWASIVVSGTWSPVILLMNRSRRIQLPDSPPTVWGSDGSQFAVLVCHVKVSRRSRALTSSLPYPLTVSN